MISRKKAAPRAIFSSSVSLSHPPSSPVHTVGLVHVSPAALPHLSSAGRCFLFILFLHLIYSVEAGEGRRERLRRRRPRTPLGKPGGRGRPPFPRHPSLPRVLPSRPIPPGWCCCPRTISHQPPAPSKHPRGLPSS